jgi:catechol 2,3-dioxygenase-like lactoylglutathione lyase family enzyme
VIDPKGNHISFQVITTDSLLQLDSLLMQTTERGHSNGLICLGSFCRWQCADMGLMKTRLRDMDLEFVATRVRDGETVVEQLFFHDPDGNVIEICDCEKLPVVPLVVRQPDAAACRLSSQAVVGANEPTCMTS